MPRNKCRVCPATDWWPVPGLFLPHTQSALLAINLDKIGGCSYSKNTGPWVVQGCVLIPSGHWGRAKQRHGTKYDTSYSWRHVEKPKVSFIHVWNMCGSLFVAVRLIIYAKQHSRVLQLHEPRSQLYPGWTRVTFDLFNSPVYRISLCLLHAGLTFLHLQTFWIKNGSEYSWIWFDWFCVCVCVCVRGPIAGSSFCMMIFLYD